jgi:2-hydroxychromene-2-carboxylate isomerase
MAIPFYFDFISPYSWIALLKARQFASRYDIRWNLQPIVYAKVLQATGLTGPAEQPQKRAQLFQDLVRCADRIGATVVGPPTHPFRSIEALRTACLFREDEAGLDLSIAIADAAWGQGKDLTDITVLASVVEQVGLDAANLEERIQAQAVKDDLKKLTDDALTHGVFGVPTFILGDEIFWGQDRLDHLGGRIAGDIPSPHDRAEAMLKRPQTVSRKR